MDDIVDDPPLAVLPTLEETPVITPKENTSQSTEPVPSNILSQATALLPSFAHNLHSTPHVTEPTTDTPEKGFDTNDEPEDKKDDPSTMTELSRYVLMVGFGVCVVAMRVMLKRIGGRGGVLKP